VALQSDGDDHSFGLLFGFKNWDNYYEFDLKYTVTKSKLATGLECFYRIAHVDQGVLSSTGWIKNAWLSTAEFQGMYTPNTLKVVKIDDWLGFYINNLPLSESGQGSVPYYVNTIKGDVFAGKKIGFVVNSKVKVKYSRLLIKQLGLDETSPVADVLGSVLTGPEPVTLLEDDFSSNVNNWAGLTDSTCDIGVKDGVYSFDKKNANGRSITKSVFLAAGNDYELQCRTRWVSGVDNFYYGITWGFKDWKNYQEFVIDKKGDCRYMSTLYGTTNKIKVSIKPQEENRLKISRVKDSLYFYVNDALVIKAPDLSPAGFDAGLIVYNRQKVLFDDLKITQQRIFPSELPASPVAEETMQQNEGAFSEKVLTNDISRRWSPGITEFEHDTENGSGIWKEYYLNPLDNFSIKEKLKWVEGDTTMGYGLVWGLKDWDNYNEFLIAKDGHFKCTTVHDKAVITTGWRQNTPFVTGDENTLEVRRRGSFAEFYINGKLAAVMPFYELYGYFTGVIIYGKQTVGLENLTLQSIPVSRPEFELGHATYKVDFEKAPAVQDAGNNESHSTIIEGGKLHMLAQFPELEDGSGQISNRALGYITSNMLPSMLTYGMPQYPFSIEITMGIGRNFHSIGAGLRVGGTDFLVDPDGNFTIGEEAPQPIEGDIKPSKNIYRLKVICEAGGRMDFYINGSYVSSINDAMKSRDAGPVIYAYSKPTEVWFDDYTVRVYRQ
ncbi:MAG: hypothetical protein ACM3P0_10250, partial [Acidobacteriota bacterium]